MQKVGKKQKSLQIRQVQHLPNIAEVSSEKYGKCSSSSSSSSQNKAVKIKSNQNKIKINSKKRGERDEIAQNSVTTVLSRQHKWRHQSHGESETTQQKALNTILNTGVNVIVCFESKATQGGRSKCKKSKGKNVLLASAAATYAHQRKKDRMQKNCGWRTLEAKHCQARVVLLRCTKLGEVHWRSWSWLKKKKKEWQKTEDNGDGFAALCDSRKQLQTANCSDWTVTVFYCCCCCCRSRNLSGHGPLGTFTHSFTHSFAVLHSVIQLAS